MSPLEINEKTNQLGPDVSNCGRRPSLKGFLSMSLARYVELVDWTGRSVRAKNRGSVPDGLSPVLQRIGIDPSHWCDLVEQFGRLFKRAAGTCESLAREAQRRDQSYLQAPGSRCFLAAAT